jgi:hemolysin III
MPLTKQSAPILEHHTGRWRPLWRGRVHALAACVSIPAGTFLVWHASGAMATVASAVYVASLVALYVTSASYHLFSRSPRAQRTMQQLDHAMIFVLIAGSYTPVCLLTLPLAYAITMLSIVWTLATLGMAVKLKWHARRVTSALYIFLGWVGVFIFPTAWSVAGPMAVMAIAAGGILYTVGAILFSTQKPRLVPHVFGFHEVWHVFTVLAGIAQFFGIGIIVANASS